ncbi:MAG TPA: HTTM domain-containing protein [Saprospiraceae bacterium]|nr:HTTM domain-containing protein [Saprospiraceae bacterium]
MKFVLKDEVSGKVGEINYRYMVNSVQVQAMLYDPRMVRRFTQWVLQQGAKKGTPNARVYVKIKFSYNGRPQEYFVDPERDLARVPYSPFEKFDLMVPVK